MEIEIKELCKDDYERFKSYYPYHKPLGMMFEESCSRVILKGEWTPYLTARDCGDHYIVARFDRYDRIEKDNLKVTRDVEDK